MANKKIGIATIALENSFNYGNKLQAFALQEFLQINGFSVETIRYQSDYIAQLPLVSENNIYNKLKMQSFGQSVNDALRIINRRIQKKKLNRKRISRERKFAQFEKKYITYTDQVYYADSDFSNLVRRFDYFITGSDQVWNPYYEGTNAFFYLGFAPEGKRISYAPSIAHSVIPDALKEKYRTWLSQIDSLSIREKAGQELIRTEFGLEAKLVCDPVFLVSQERWHQIAEKKERSNKYFLVYILGKKTVETKNQIRAFEKKYNVKAIDVYSRDETNSMFAGPEEFLGLIENSEFVFTDSFHGTAFSVIFKKPMVIVPRGENRTISRVESLLEILGIDNRDADTILREPEKLYFDYRIRMQRMEVFIAESKAYLLQALEKAEGKEIQT